MAFDIEGARKEGYSDSEIASYLAQKTQFDVAGAKKEGYSDADIISYLSSKDTPQTKQPEHLEENSTNPLLAFGKSAVESTIPSAAGLYAAGRGAALGMRLPGPLPVKVLGAVGGGLLGGVAGGMAGEEAQQFASKYIPETWKESLGFDAERRALETKEHPYMSYAGQLAPNLAFFRPGAVAPILDNAGKTILGSGAQRAIMGGAGAGIEAGSELVSEGKVDPVKLAMAGAFQAGAPVSTRLGKRVFGDIVPHGITEEKVKLDPNAELGDKAVYIERVMPEVEATIEELKLKLLTTKDEKIASALAKKLEDEETVLAGMREDLKIIRQKEASGEVTIPKKPIEEDVQGTLPGIETPPKTNVEVPTSDLNLPVDTQVPVSSGLVNALNNSTRESSLVGKIIDPIAQDVLNSNSIKSLDGILASHGIRDLKPLSGGASSVVLDAGDKVVRLGLGEVTPRPNIPEVIQPLASGTVGYLRYEILPKINTKNISKLDVKTMETMMENRGYLWDDAAIDNLGRLDGKLVILDPGGISKLKHGSTTKLETPIKNTFQAARTYEEVHANFLDQLGKMEERAWGTDTLDKVIANKEQKLADSLQDPVYGEATYKAIEAEVEALRNIRDGKMTPTEAAQHLREGSYDAITHVGKTVEGITPELQAAIKSNRLVDGVRAIADNMDMPQGLRNLADRLLKNENFGKFTNIFYDNQIKHGMQTSHQTGDIAVRSGADVNPVSYMHESVHTSTSGAMLLFGKGRNLVSPTIAKAMDNILGIYDSLKGKNYNALVKALDGDKQLADLLLTNERELLAYALTDEKFGAALNSMMDGNKSIFRRLLDNISEAFGFTKKQEKTMLDSLYESAGVLIDEYQGPVDKIGIHGFDPIFNYRDKDGDIGMGARDKFLPIAQRFLSPWAFKNFWRDNPIVNKIADIDLNAQRIKDQVVSLVLHGKTTVEQYKKLPFLQRLDRATSPEGLLPAMQKLNNKEIGELVQILLLGERDGLDAPTLIATHGAGLTPEQRNAVLAIHRAGDLLFEAGNVTGIPGETKYRAGYFLRSNTGDNLVTASRNGVVTRMEFYLTKAEQQRAAKRFQEAGLEVELSDRKPDVDYEGIMQTLNDILETGNKTGIPLDQLISAKTEAIELQSTALGGHRKHRGFLRGFAGDISSLTLEENGKAFRHALETNVKTYANLIYKRQLAYESAKFFYGEGAELSAQQPNATSVARYYLDNQLGQLKSPAEGKISGTVNSLLNEAFAKAFPDVHLERDVLPYAYNLLTRGAYNMVLTSAPVTWVTQALGFLQSGRMLFKENSNPMYAAAAIGKALSNVFFKQYSDDALQGMHYIAQNTEVFHKHMTSEVADYVWSSDKKTIASKLYRWFSGEVFTSAGDAFSRVVAWNMANELLLRSNPEMSPQMRWEKAGEMTAESMIKMGRENLPGMYKELGFVGSAISPLKSYVHGQFSNLAVDVKDVIMQRDAASVMALAMNGLGMLMVGGGLALPFMADYEYLRQSAVKNGMIAYDALPNWTKFMEERDPVISRGLISGLTGIDMGASMRYQSIMKPFAETMAPESFMDALLPVSTASKFVSGATTIAKNAFGGVSDWQVDKAIEKVVPRGYIRGGIDAFRHAGEDVVRMGERGEAFAERGAPEIAAKFLGSKSLGEAKAAAIRTENEARTQWATAQKSKAVDLFLSQGKNDVNQGIDIMVDLVTKGEWTPKEFTDSLKNQLDKHTRTYVQRMITNKRGEVKSAAQKRALTNIIDMMEE